MTLRRSFLWAASAALTVFLIVLLIKISKLDLRVTVQQLRSVSWFSFTRLVLLTALHVYLSNLKWRRVDTTLRHSTRFCPIEDHVVCTHQHWRGTRSNSSRAAQHVGRTHAGDLFSWKGVKTRELAARSFEQAFDVLIVGFLAMASGVHQTLP